MRALQHLGPYSAGKLHSLPRHMSPERPHSSRSFQEKVSQAPEEEEEEGIQETFTSSKAEAAKSSSLSPGICLSPFSHPMLALEGESVPKIFRD